MIRSMSSISEAQFPQLVNQIYPMAQYSLPRGGQTLLPRNLMTWLFEEIRTQPTSYWKPEYAEALPYKVSAFMRGYDVYIS